jgi:hypothetical protein
MTNPFAPAASAGAPAPNLFGTAAPTQTAGGGQPADDPFGAPAPQAERPRISDMDGRLVLISPKRCEYGIPNRLGNPGDTQDRLTADVVVLTGGPLEYGGKPEKRIPHTKRADIPHEIKGLYISQKGLVSQCANALEAYIKNNGQPTMVLGTLYEGEKNGKANGPWLLRPATDEDAQIARAYLASRPPADPFGR